jgi:uncharacterized membrane protein YfcA
MDLLHELLALQILAIFGAFLGEAVASELLTSVAVGAFAVALLAMFVQMTGSLLSGLRRSAGPDMAVESRQ